MRTLYEITVLRDGEPLTSRFTHIVDLADPTSANAQLLELLAGAILRDHRSLEDVWQYALVLRQPGVEAPAMPEFRATYPQVAALGMGK